MQQPSMHINAQNKNNKKEQANFIHFNDVRQPVAHGNSYLAAEKINQQMTRIKTNDSTLMFDIFGASDY